MLNLKDIDLIGKEIKIINSSDLTKIGVNGIVINETKNIVVIRKKNNEITTIKKNEILKMVV